MKRLRLLAAALAILTTGSAVASPPPEPAARTPAPRILFADASAESGVGTVTWCGREEKPHLLESGGNGLALFDYDGDGDLDLYLVSGWRLDGSRIAERSPNALYRNRGDGTFDEVTAGAGVGDDGWGTGVAVGDADGDGLEDLLVTNFGPDVLYHNRGDGTFATVAGAPSIDGWSTGAVLFDADGDGDRDLYLGGQVDCTLDAVLTAEPELRWEGMMVMLGPFGLEGLGNHYFENLGGGSFREASESAGLADAGVFYTFTAAALDLDGDLDLDLYVANDSNPNYLYRNDGRGHFQEVGLWSGGALDEDGNAQAGMGLAPADVDGDGLVDLLVTNFGRDVSTLYHNLGDFNFEDVTRARGIAGPTYLPLSWGTVFADFELDGDLDLFIANGHIYPQADLATEVDTSFRQRNLLLAQSDGRFTDVTADAGPGLAVVESSRGLAAGDLDGDGDTDLVVANVDATPTLLRNDSNSGGGWLVVDAPAALKAVVEAGGKSFVRHRTIGGSFLSVSDQRFHFGLGPATSVDRLTVQWPDGRRTVLRQLAAGRVVRLARPAGDGTTGSRLPSPER